MVHLNRQSQKRLHLRSTLTRKVVKCLEDGNLVHLELLKDDLISKWVPSKAITHHAMFMIGRVNRRRHPLSLDAMWILHEIIQQMFHRGAWGDGRFMEEYCLKEERSLLSRLIYQKHLNPYLNIKEAFIQQRKEFFLVRKSFCQRRLVENMKIFLQGSHPRPGSNSVVIQYLPTDLTEKICGYVMNPLKQ